MALWPQVPAAHYPQRRSGGPLARVMLPLAGVDLLENQGTLWALALSTPPAVTPGWWSHEVLVGLVAVGVAVLSALKFVLLGAVLVLLVQMLLAWRPPRAVRGGVQG